MKRQIKLFRRTVLVFLFFCKIFSINAIAVAPSVWIVNSAERAFKSSSVPGSPVTAITLYAAKGEYEAAQILVRSTASQSNVYVGTTALTGPGGATIPLANMGIWREYDHANVIKTGTDYQNPPDGSNCYTDALMGNVAATVAANTTATFYYKVYVASSQTPGTYTGTATVYASGGNVTVNVTVVVYDVTVPPTQQSHLMFESNIVHVGWGVDGVIDAIIPYHYGCAIYSDNWWTVMSNIAKQMAKDRKNCVFTDFQALLVPDTTIDGGGNYTFGWTTFDKYIQTFIDANALQYIYITRQLEPDDSSPPSYRKVWTIQKVGGVVKRVLADCNTTTSNNYFNTLFPAFKSHLDAKGWTSKLIMVADDENYNSHAAAKWLYDKFHYYFPSGRTTEAIQYTSDLLSQLTDYTEWISYYHNIYMGGGVDDEQSIQLSRFGYGKKIWLYACTGTYDPFMNRFLSYHLTKLRLFPWLVDKIDGVGQMHWAYNYWASAPTSTLWDGSNDGDQWIIYPNVSTYDVYSSVRNEAERDGCEDVELLYQLKQTNPTLAKSIVNTILRDMVNYSITGSDVVNAHKHILDALIDPNINGSGTGKFNYSSDFSAGNNWDWNPNVGTWSVSSGAYCQTSQSGTSFSCLESRSYDDFAMNFDVKIVNDSGNSQNWAGVMLRNQLSTDSETGYMVVIRNNGQIVLYRTGAALGYANVSGYSAGSYVTIKVKVAGSHITVWAGTTPTSPVIDVNDVSAYLSGNIALISYGVSAAWDNITINAEQNVAQAGTVSYSSTYTGGGWFPQAVADGINDSVTTSLGWVSNNSTGSDHTESVTIDFGKVYNIDRVDLCPRNDSGEVGHQFPIDFTIATSTNGSNFTTQVTKVNYPRPGNAPQGFGFASVNARYVKVTGTHLYFDDGAYRMGFAEIRAYGNNLAAGKIVTASSTYESDIGWGLKYATDGIKLGTNYTSLGSCSSTAAAGSDHTEWVKVDLGGKSTVNNVVLYPRSDAGCEDWYFPKTFTIQTSPDDSTYTTQITKINYTLNGTGAQSFPFTAVSNVR